MLVYRGNELKMIPHKCAQAERKTASHADDEFKRGCLCVNGTKCTLKSKINYTLSNRNLCGAAAF